MDVRANKGGKRLSNEKTGLGAAFENATEKVKGRWASFSNNSLVQGIGAKFGQFGNFVKTKFQHAGSDFVAGYHAFKDHYRDRHLQRDISSAMDFLGEQGYDVTKRERDYTAEDIEAAVKVLKGSGYSVARAERMDTDASDKVEKSDSNTMSEGKPAPDEEVKATKKDGNEKSDEQKDGNGSPEAKSDGQKVDTAPAGEAKEETGGFSMDRISKSLDSISKEDGGDTIRAMLAMMVQYLNAPEEQRDLSGLGRQVMSAGGKLMSDARKQEQRAAQAEQIAPSGTDQAKDFDKEVDGV